MVVRHALSDLGLDTPGKLTELVQRKGQGYEIGAGQHVDPTQIQAISAESAPSKYNTLHSSMASDGQNGTVHYQVPAGKTLVIVGVLYQIASAATSLMVGYGDNAVSESATAPTNAVGLTPRALLISGTSEKVFQSLLLRVPASKYPYIYTTGTAYCIVFGIER